MNIIDGVHKKHIIISFCIFIGVVYISLKSTFQCAWCYFTFEFPLITK
jgi:hypothetical protein